MSMPDGWECRMTNLASMSDKDGREGIRNAMKELVQEGYAKLISGYVGEDKVTHGKHYVISDEPIYRGDNIKQKNR